MYPYIEKFRGCHLLRGKGCIQIAKVPKRRVEKKAQQDFCSCSAICFSIAPWKVEQLQGAGCALQGHHSNLAKTLPRKLINVCGNSKLFYNKIPARKGLLIISTANSRSVMFTCVGRTQEVFTLYNRASFKTSVTVVLCHFRSKSIKEFADNTMSIKDWQYLAGLLQLSIHRTIRTGMAPSRPCSDHFSLCLRINLLLHFAKFLL